MILIITLMFCQDGVQGSIAIAIRRFGGSGRTFQGQVVRRMVFVSAIYLCLFATTRSTEISRVFQKRCCHNCSRRDENAWQHSCGPKPRDCTQPQWVSY